MVNENSTNESMEQKRLDSFNDHQKDNRGRATQLVNYAFLLAGGTFTASITVFSSRAKSQITPAIVSYLHNGWYNLFLSMVAFFGVIFIMIFRDYFTAEAIWRRRLQGRTPYVAARVSNVILVSFEFVIISCGIFGFITLSYGLHQIMEAACSLIA